MANINNTSSTKNKLSKSPTIPIEMLLKFQLISSKQVSSKDFTRKCKSTIFKKNLMKWAMMNNFNNISLVYNSSKETIFQL